MDIEEKKIEKSDKEILRNKKREVDRSKRNLERIKRKLEFNKKKMLLEIKKMAKKGQILGAKMLAKDIVRLTHKINKIEQFIGQLTAISMRISFYSSLNVIDEAMNNTIKALTTVNNILNTQKFNNVGKELAKENMKFDLNSEMFEDILDGVGDSTGNEEEEKNLLEEILNEAGIKIGDEMIDASKEKLNCEKDKNNIINQIDEKGGVNKEKNNNLDNMI